MIAGAGLKYRVHPTLRYVSINADRIEISRPFGAKRLRTSARIGTRLQSFSAEASLTQEALVHGLGKEVFEALRKYHFLLPEDASPALAGGLCVPAQQPVGWPLSVFDVDMLRVGDAALLHAPIETTTGSGVAVATGGQRVRAQLSQCFMRSAYAGNSGVMLDLDFGTKLDERNLRLFDLGDVKFSPAVDSAREVGERLAYVCQRVVHVGGVPIVLGGDHAQAFYTIGALAERYPHLGVLHIDAHPDLYALGAACDAELNHANVMHWVRRMEHVAAIWQVGIRDFYRQPTHQLHCEKDPKIQAISAFEAETRGYTRLLAQMDRSLPWFISFDVDALSNAEQPQTATPVLGGLSFYPLLACFDQLIRDFRIVGMEFVEIGDADHGAHGVAAIAARLIGRYVFHLSGAEPYNGSVYTLASSA